MIRRWCTLGALLSLLAGAGCVAPPEAIPEAQVWSREQAKTFLSSAQDPRRYGLTVYTGGPRPTYQFAHRVHEGQSVILRFKRGGAPVIRFKQPGGRSVRALVDSSSTASWATPLAGGRLQLILLSPPLHQETPGHVEDKIPGLGSLARSLKFDTLRMENAVLLLRLADGPLGALARGAAGPPEVVLGTQFLSCFHTVQIDYSSGKLLLATTQDYSPSPDHLGSATMRSVQGALAVEARIDDWEGPVVLDTAGDYGLILPEGFPGPINHLALGELVLPPGLSASETPSGLTDLGVPRIGRRLLSRYRLPLDHTARVHFEKPAKAR